MMRAIILPLLLLFGSALPVSAARVSVWVHPRAPESLVSLQRHGLHVDEVNPFWYVFDAAGNLSARRGANDPNWRGAMSGMDLVPVFENKFDGVPDEELTHALMGNAEARAAHVDEIVQLAVVNAYDGVEIHYLWMNAETRHAFSSFIEELAAALHAVDKTLSVAVHAKTAETADPGPAAQDWYRIGRAADTVKILAHDFTRSVAAPVVPAENLRAVVRYAKTLIPEEKIVVALSWYGYEWPTRDALTYDAVQALIAEHHPVVNRTADGDLWFTYGDGRVVYFQDAETYARRVSLVRQMLPDLAGFAHMQAGDEDVNVWDVVATINDTRRVGRRRSAGF